MATFSKDVAKNVKKNIKQGAIQGISKAVFGKGIIGSALGKAFESKFKDKEEKDTRVADALEEQSNIENNNSAVLTRIESIVMNIADNVYNLAGVMNAQVVSMQDAQRIEQERRSREEAAKEEAADEAQKVSAPTASATPPTSEKKGGGLLSSIMDSVGSTKKMFKGFLKKFAIVAVGLTAALAGAAYAMGDNPDKNLEDATDETMQEGAPPPSAEPVPGTGGTDGAAGAAAESGMQRIIVELPGGPLSFKNQKEYEDWTENPEQYATQNVGGTNQVVSLATPAASTSAPATPIAPPPTPNATPTPSDTPPAAAQPVGTPPTVSATSPGGTRGQITVQLPGGATVFEDKKQYDDWVANPQKYAIQNVGGVQQVVPFTSAPPSGAAAPAAGPAGGAMGSGGESGVGSSGGSAGGGSAASPVQAPAPSSGSEVASASTAVAAASEPQTPKNSSTEINNSSSESNPPPAIMLSPIADRGSIDAGTVFNSMG